MSSKTANAVALAVLFGVFMIGFLVGLSTKGKSDPYTALVTVELEEVKLFCTDKCKFIVLANLPGDGYLAKDSGASMIGWPNPDADGNRRITFNVSDSRMNLLLGDTEPTCSVSTGPKICSYKLPENRVYSFTFAEQQDESTGLWERVATPN